MAKKRKLPPARRIREEDDYDDEYEEDRPRRRRPVESGRPGVLAIILASFGLIALAVLAVSPSLTWFGIHCESREGGTGARTAYVGIDGSGYRKVDLQAPSGTKVPPFAQAKPERLPSEARPEGLAIRIIAILGVLLLVPVFMLGALLPLPAAGRRAIWGCGAATVAALTILLIIWQLAWLAKIAWVVQKNPTIEVDQDWGAATTLLRPNIGLYMGLTSAILAAILISAAANRGLRGVWVRLFELGGVFLGLAVACLIVRPWDVEPFFKALFPR